MAQWEEDTENGELCGQGGAGDGLGGVHVACQQFVGGADWVQQRHHFEDGHARFLRFAQPAAFGRLESGGRAAVGMPAYPMSRVEESILQRAEVSDGLVNTIDSFVT